MSTSETSKAACRLKNRPIIIHRSMPYTGVIVLSYNQKKLMIISFIKKINNNDP